MKSSIAIVPPRRFAVVPEPLEHLRHPCPADTEMAGESGFVFKPARVEQCLIVAGQLERIASLFGSVLWFWFLRERGIPGEEGNDWRST